jgi:PAS domain S-box-containing protein
VNIEVSMDVREARRVAALHAYDILDTPREAAFDEVADLAAKLCGTSMAVVSLIDTGRQFFKAEVGLGVRETPLETSFCAKAILEDDFLLVPDARLDPRFDRNPLVTGEPNLRFYAGALLKTDEGLAIGTLCVLDTEPRTLTKLQQQALKVLANQVMAQLELRLTLRHREESEARHRAMVESATDYAIIATDLTGHVIEWNSGAEYIFGWSEAEMLGQSADRMFTAEDRADGSIEKEMKAARETGRGGDERWRLRKDGTRLWASGAIMPLKTQDGDLVGYLKVLRDRTDERCREERLALMSRISAALLDARDPDAVLRPLLEQSRQLLGFDECYSYALTPDREHLTLTFSIESSQEMRDMLVDIGLDVPISGIVAETRQPLVIDNLQETTADRYEIGRASGYRAFAAFPIVSGDTLHGVMSFLSRDRTSFDHEALDFFATIARYVAVVRSRLQNEQAIGEGEEKLRFAMEAAGQGDWELDIPSLSFFPSDQCKVNFGRSPDEPFTYDQLVESVHPEDRPRMWDTVTATVETHGLYDIEYRCIRTDGSVGWVHITGRPTYAEDGTPLSLLGVSSDISERKAAEIALKALNDTLEQRVEETIAERELAQSALRQSQKMEAMGQLTGGVAHDFNNLLTPIIGSLDLLNRRSTNTEREARLIDGALQSAERAKVLVQRLLAFARRQPLQSGAVDVAALIANMVDLIESTSGAQFAVRTEIAPDLPPALADGNQLEMAILNLAVNARDAMPDGGMLTVAARLEEEDAAIASGLAGGRWIRLSVADNGIGMDAETARRAIEPFYSTKGIGKGTGLGLSMVHGLALQLGGTMTITSALGLGTRVDLWLPISPVAVETAAATIPDAPDVQRSGRVLVVDDEPLVRMTTADMLQNLGYEAVEVPSAASAETLLRAGEQFDMVVTDHLMPDITGAELAGKIKANWPTLKVLIVSGYADVDGIAPDFARLTKPFREAELAEAIYAL